MQKKITAPVVPVVNEALNTLIKKAQGHRTQNAYAASTGVSSAALTRIRQGYLHPSPTVLKKLASQAMNDVTYEDFMRAMNYMKPDKLLEEGLPPEVVLIARKTENMSEEDKNRLFKIFNSTIDTFLEKYD